MRRWNWVGRRRGAGGRASGKGQRWGPRGGRKKGEWPSDLVVPEWWVGVGRAVAEGEPPGGERGWDNKA